VNGFIDHLYTRLGISSIYSATANLHNSQITTSPVSLLQAAVSSPAVPWQRLLPAEIPQLHALRFYLHSLPYRTHLKSKSELLYDWRFTAKQFVLASSPLRNTNTYIFFSTEPLRSWSLCNTLSDEKIDLPLMNMLGLSSRLN
jgi:hypothetical protein